MTVRKSEDGERLQQVSLDPKLAWTIVVALVLGAMSVGVALWKIDENGKDIGTNGQELEKLSKMVVENKEKLALPRFTSVHDGEAREQDRRENRAEFDRIYNLFGEIKQSLGVVDRYILADTRTSTQNSVLLNSLSEDLDELKAIIKSTK